MGAEQHFIDKKISAANLLARVMRRSLKQMTPGINISDAVFGDWEREAKAIKGDPLELAAAIDWAITKSDYWTGYLDSMSKFAAKLDVILGQYRGAARSQKIEGGVPEPASLTRLREVWPDTPKQSIIPLEWKRRLDLLRVETHKACTKCDENGLIPSPSGFKDLKGNLCMVPCPACKKKLDAEAKKIFQRVKDEVNGKAASA